VTCFFIPISQFRASDWIDFGDAPVAGTAALGLCPSLRAAETEGEIGSQIFWKWVKTLPDWLAVNFSWPVGVDLGGTQSYLCVTLFGA
jgi:hypothetical protein